MFKKVMNRKGFTLIELIVVMAILAILGAIAIPRFVGTQTTANIRAHNANVATLRSAAEVCLAEHGNPSGAVTWNATTDGSAVDADFDRDNYIATFPAAPSGTGVAGVDGAAYSVTISTAGVIEVLPATIP